MAGSTNAWNQNVSGTNAGNQNNNNKTNTYSVVAVRRLTFIVAGLNVSYEEVLHAYYDCRKRKRNKDTTTYFEMNLSQNIVNITESLRDGTWTPGISMCFAVTYPKVREIWAAEFYDRVVHHVVYNRLRPRIEPKFLSTSFACIPERGTIKAKEWAERSARRITANWSQPAWFLQLDVANFFPSIVHQTLINLIDPFIHESWLRLATERIYKHDPTENVHFPGDPKLLELVPRNKSLWSIPTDRGLPIGNLTSQFGANVYMNEVDQFINHDLCPRFYGRYVDDLIFFDTDKDKLLSIQDQVIRFLKEKLDLSIHPGKTRLQPVSHGVDFVGYVIKPYRTYIRRRTVHQARAKSSDVTTSTNILSTVNSYLGMFKHADTYNLRRSLSDLAISVHPELTSTDGYEKVIEAPY